MHNNSNKSIDLSGEDTDDQKVDVGAGNNSLVNMFDSVSEMFKLLTKKLDSKKDDHLDDDDLDMTAQRQKKATLRFKGAKYLQLGMLVKPTDPNYGKNQPKTTLSLSKNASLKTKSKYFEPKTWAEWSILFNRLIRGYMVNGHGDQTQALFQYMEELNQHRNSGKYSDQALIAYDDRVRYNASPEKPFDWVLFNHLSFIHATDEFPLLETSLFSSKSKSKGDNSSKTNNGHTGKHTFGYRNSKGVCHAWADKKACTNENSSSGCKFAHWCTEPKCKDANVTDHSPKECPNQP